MKRIIVFLVVVYLISAVGVWGLLSVNTSSNIKLANENTSLKNELAATKNAITVEKVAREQLEKKIILARENVVFLSLALCPTLEASDKNALCVKNSTEWLSQTIVAGTALSDTESKAKMDTLLIALGKKTKPTAKQLYEMLKPIEVAALSSLVQITK